MFVTPAWLLRGLGNTPGWLATDDRRLAFTDSQGAAVFDVALEEVSDVTWPWYYFQGGCKLTVDGQQLRLSFTRPNGAAHPGRSFSAADLPPHWGVNPAAVANTLGDISEGRAAGKEWRARLAGGVRSDSS